MSELSKSYRLPNIYCLFLSVLYTARTRVHIHVYNTTVRCRKDHPPAWLNTLLIRAREPLHEYDVFEIFCKKKELYMQKRLLLFGAPKFLFFSCDNKKMYDRGKKKKKLRRVGILKDLCYYDKNWKRVMKYVL